MLKVQLIPASVTVGMEHGLPVSRTQGSGSLVYILVSLHPCSPDHGDPCRGDVTLSVLHTLLPFWSG